MRSWLSASVSLILGVTSVYAETKPAASDTQALFAGRPLKLAANKQPLATVVYGGKTEPAALRFRDSLAAQTGVQFPVVLADDVLEKGKFAFQPTWHGKTLILVGNVDNNRAFLPLYVRFLVGANHAYPGPGRYESRSLLEPLHAGGDILLIGGSDENGLAAGVEQVAKRLAAAADAQGNILVRPFVEVGDATGPISYASGYRGRGVDGFYWEANVAAGLEARRALLQQVDAYPADPKPWRGDHYTWESRYRALLKMLAAGIFEPPQVERIQRMLYENLVLTDDPWGKKALGTPAAEWNRCMCRHTLSAYTGQLLLADYLHHVAPLDPETKKEVEGCHSNLMAILDEIVRSRRYRGGIEGEEGLDVLENLANVLLCSGDEATLRSGLLRDMAGWRLAVRDNLGCHAGVDSYIGSRPGDQLKPVGAAGLCTSLGAWFLSDPELLGIAGLDASGVTVPYLGVALPPEFARPDPSLQATPPASFTGLHVLPLDGFFQPFAAAFPAEAESLVRFDPSRGRAFDKAVFRDGFAADDAYLLLQGINVGTPMYREGIFANSVVRYTELGSLFLFAHTQVIGSWERNVVRISRGEPDPQSSACQEMASYRDADVSALASLQEQNGGAEWQRTILRRRRGYFVVIDQVIPRFDGDYNVSCQWRSYQHGRFVDSRRFVAKDMLNQAEMHLVSPRSCDTELVQQERDGAADPLMVRQWQRGRLSGGQPASLAKGQPVVFANLIYATRPDVPRQFDVRETGPASVLVRGKTGDFEELALVSAAGVEDLAGLSTDAHVAYVSSAGIRLAGARTVRWPEVSIRSEAGFNLALSLEPPSIRLENRTEKASLVRILQGKKEETRELPPGRHDLGLKKLRLEAKRLSAALEKLWDKSGEGADAAPESPGTAQAEPVKPVWEAQAFKVQPRPYHGLGIQVGSEKPVEARLLADRSHHRWSTPASLPGKGGWKVAIDLAEPAEVESIRFVGYRSDQPFPEGLKFDLQLSDGASERRVADVAPGREFWYSEMEKYLETAAHPTLRVPVMARAQRVILSAQPNDGNKATYGFQEVQVFVNDPSHRVRTRLYPLRDEKGHGIIVFCSNEVLRLNAAGETVWRWKADAEIAHEFVEYASHEKRWLVGAWPLSQHFALLDASGQAILDAATFDPAKHGRMLSGHSRPHAVTLWERVPGAAGVIAFFPHFSYGQIVRAADGVQSEVGEGRGGKAVIRIPDVTGDGAEDLFVVGRYENNNGVMPSNPGAEGPLSPKELDWTRNLRPNWTGWSAGNMELTLYHGASMVYRKENGNRTWLGLVGLNPGGIDFYLRPSLERTWSHFNHPGNLCHCTGDLNGDGADEILVGREDGSLVAYEAAGGRQVLKVNLRAEIRAVAATQERIAVGTDRALVLLDRQGRELARAKGGVEALTVVDTGEKGKLLVAAFSTGLLQAFRVP